MSEIQANKISPSSGTTLTVGDSGDTVNLSSTTTTLPTSIITGQTEKSTLADADKFLISDSAASGAFKYVQKSNLPSGGLVLLESIDASNTATVEFTSFPATYYLSLIHI